MGHSGRNVSISWIHESGELRSEDTVFRVSGWWLKPWEYKGNSGILCAALMGEEEKRELA